jgi:hypothetical protein
MSRARSFKECEKTGLIKIQTAEETDEEKETATMTNVQSP